jgi:hypothetical protein
LPSGSKGSRRPTSRPARSAGTRAASGRSGNGSTWADLAATYNINVATVGTYTPGNASGNIPVSNGTLNTNLNANYLGGYAQSNYLGKQGNPYYTLASTEWVQFNGGASSGGLYFPSSTAGTELNPAYGYTYGSFRVLGGKGSYSGFVFESVSNYRSFMVNHTSGLSGMYAQNTSAWDWYYDTSVGTFYVQNAAYLVWHSGNDGSGSGLDADLLDGFNTSTAGGVNKVLVSDGSGQLILDGWIRVGGSQGLFNAAGAYFYEDPTYGWIARSRSATVSALKFQYSSTTLVGWIYGDSSGFGLLNSAGAWRLQAPNSTGTSLLRDASYTIWDSGNDGSGSGLDADLLDGMNSDAAANNSTIAARNSSGYLYATYFNSAAAVQDTVGAVVNVWYENGSDGFVRKCSMAHFKSEMGSLGALVYLSSVTASSSTSLALTGIDSTYDEYEVHLISVRPSTGSNQLLLRVSTDGGSTWNNANYTDAQAYRSTDATSNTVSAQTSNFATIGKSGEVGGATAGSVNAVIRFTKPSNTSLNKQFSVKGTYSKEVGGGAATVTSFDAVLAWNNTVAFNALQFTLNLGNFAEGKVVLYGIKTS